MALSEAAAAQKREYNRQYREEHKEQLNEYLRNWRKNNPSKTRKHYESFWERRASEKEAAAQK